MKPTYKTLILAPVLLALAACSSDEPAEGQALPEGKYPMEFSLSFAPQTRVAATADGMGYTWEEGEQITITVSQNGVEETTTITLDADGKIVSYQPQLYWTSNKPATVTACYTNLDAMSTDKYTDQSQGLPYVLAGSALAPFGKPVQLTLQHQLAQVRLKISGYRTDTFTGVKFYGYSEYKIADDGVTTGAARGYITMLYDKKLGCYMANVVPGDLTISDGSRLFSFSDVFKTDITYNAKIEAGKVYTFDIASPNPEPNLNGHAAVLMRNGTASTPALYVATCNLGASNPQSMGQYYMWGEIDGHTAGEGYNFSSNCKTENKNLLDLHDLGYISSTSEAKAELLASHDAARRTLGGDWHTPRKEEFEWLKDNCDWTWNASQYGFTIKSRETNNTVFLPNSGHIIGNTHHSDQTCYLGSIPYGTANQYGLYFIPNDSSSLMVTGFRSIGCQIRPVASVSL